MIKYDMPSVGYYEFKAQFWASQHKFNLAVSLSVYTE